MKTECVSFICPACNSSYDIFTRHQHKLMLLDCPKCKMSVSLYDGKMTKIDDIILSKIKKIQQDASESDINKLFETINERIRINRRSELTSDDVVSVSDALRECQSFDQVMRAICNL